ncbi:MAG: hypothetical protein IIT61_02045 [Bacteroidales bacterium]|nr:hypothetical protein [Bacteroidales bacterium]MBQ5457486.1 hypothetical protein [Bacteroidales bacterium]MBQ5572243.1 hypothetical protein [Bacteroidales bacterium]
MQITTKEEHIDFLNGILNQAKSLVAEGHTAVATLVMSQLIEIMGSYFDAKPMRSREQSANRFNTAIYKLFPIKYSKANRKSFLYYQLRTSIVHTLTPTCSVALKSGASDQHLVEKDEITEIYIGNLLNDTEKAVGILIRLINEDKVKVKKLAAGEIK